MNKRLVKLVEKLQNGERASVRRDQVAKAIQEGGFDYFIYRGYDEVYSVEPKKLSANINNIESYFLNDGTMWAKLDKENNMLEITISYGYSYMELWASIEDKKETITEQPQEVKEVATTSIEGIEVIFNEEKNGIEIKFESKELATVEIREQIKSVGFRYYAKFQKWIAKQTPESIELVNKLFLNNCNNKNEVSEVIENDITDEPRQLPDAMDFNNIETLRHKYITNWDSIPEELQQFILSCDKYWIDLQEVILYQDRKAVASMGISRWGIDITVNSIGAWDLFQWELYNGFTINNLNSEPVAVNEVVNFDNVEEIKTLDKDIFINCLVPSLNKNNTIELNNECIQESSHLEKFKIQKIVKLNYKQYKYFTNNLLHDYDFLTGLGGWEEDDNGKLLYYYGVAVVCDNEEVLIIDPSGTSYARYCCQYLECVNNSLQNELNNINTKISINNNLYKEALNSIEDNKLYEIKADNKTVITDDRFIKNIVYNGLTVVTGKTIKELITENKGIDILNLTVLKINIKDFMQGLIKHDTRKIFSLFPSEIDKQIANIKFMDRLQTELNRACIV